MNLQILYRFPVSALQRSHPRSWLLRERNECWLHQCGVSGEVFSAFTDTLLVGGCVLVADHIFHAEKREAYSTALEMVVEPEGQPTDGSLCSIFYT